LITNWRSFVHSGEMGAPSMVDQLLTGNIWKQISSKARKEKRRLAAVAYVSDATQLRLRKGDVLICDASDRVIKSGGTTAAALRRYLGAKVELFHYSNLHAKLVVLGPHVLVGSCNLSDSAANTLREIALLSSRSSIRSQAVAFIRQTQSQAKAINGEFVDRIAKIKVVKRKWASKVRRKNIQELGRRTWVVRTSELDETRYQDEAADVRQAEKQVINLFSEASSEVGWIRWTYKCGFLNLAKRGDTIIQLYSAEKGKRVTAYEPVAILKRQERKKWTRFYYEEREDGREMSWTSFERKLKKLGINSIRKASTRELTSTEAVLIDTIWGEAV